MNRFVVDASVALKWVVADTGSIEASTLRWADQLIAPDLLIAECANALWKMARRAEITTEDAVLAARTLEQSDIELYPMRRLLAPATQLATRLDHPAYDCVYLALARNEGCALVTADERLIRKLTISPTLKLPRVLTLGEAAQLVAPG